jgi:hypothetical protein
MGKRRLAIGEKVIGEKVIGEWGMGNGKFSYSLPELL